MSSFGQPASRAIEQHAAELAALRRMLMASEGSFSLSVSICNSPRLRDELIDGLVADEANILVVRVPHGTKDIFSFVQNQEPRDDLTALFIVGLEGSFPACADESDDSALRSLNAARELWKERFHCPVVLWLPGYAATLLSVKARDLWAWRSHQFEFAVAYEDLPPDSTDFTGREKEIRLLLRVLRSDEPNAAIYGMPGVGKSALAVHVAHQVTGAYPDACIAVDMGGPNGALVARDAIVQVLRAFDPRTRVPKETAAAGRIYREFLSRRKVLVLLDDISEESQVIPLIPPQGGSALLVTSRNRLDLPRFHHLELDPFPADSAVELLNRLVGRDRLSREDAVRIAETCEFQPLALRLAGNFLKLHEDWTVDDYQTAIAQARGNLGRVAQTEQARLDLEAMLELGAVQLLLGHPDLARSWQLLSVFPETFDLAAVAAVWDVAEDAAPDRMEELVSRGLVLFDTSEGRYRLHDLMRGVARDPFRYSGEIDAVRAREALDRAQLRHAKYYLALLKDGPAALTERGEADGESIEPRLKLLETEWPNVVAGQAWSAQAASGSAEANELCIQYAKATPVLSEFGVSTEVAAAWLESGVEAAHRQQNAEAEGRLLWWLGNTCLELGQTEQAIDAYERALQIVGPADDPDQARVSYDLGVAHAHAGDLERAESWIERSLSLSRQRGDKSFEASALHTLGSLALESHDPKGAIAYFQRALDISRQTNDRGGEATLLSDLGWAYASAGEHDQATKWLYEALAVAHKWQDHWGQIDALERLGEVHEALGEPRQAIEYFEQALRVSREIGYTVREAHQLGKLGAALADIGQLSEAREYLFRAAELARETGDPQQELIALYTLGEVYALQDRFYEALAEFEQALELAQRLGDLEAEARILLQTAEVQSKLKQVDAARDAAERASKILQQIPPAQAIELRKRVSEWLAE